MPPSRDMLVYTNAQIEGMSPSTDISARTSEERTSTEKIRKGLRKGLIGVLNRIESVLMGTAKKIEDLCMRSMAGWGNVSKGRGNVVFKSKKGGKV